MRITLFEGIESRPLLVLPQLRMQLKPGILIERTKRRPGITKSKASTVS